MKTLRDPQVREAHAKLRLALKDFDDFIYDDATTDRMLKTLRGRDEWDRMLGLRRQNIFAAARALKDALEEEA